MKQAVRVGVFGVAVMALVAFSAASFAGDHGRSGEKGRKNHERYEDHEDDEDRDHEDRGDEGRHYDNHETSAEGTLIDIALALFGDDERTEIRHYIGEEHRRNCPPGLAKKHNGCMPPGLSKKYQVGDYLHDDVEIIPVSDDLMEHLHPRKGYYYAQVDGDVLLISEATKKIVDAVTLLSAVGN